MKAERITREEVLAAVRASGSADAAQVAAVVLETDGSLSILADGDGAGRLPALDTVRRVDDARSNSSHPRRETASSHYGGAS
jgi:hypothetical protein